MNPNIIDMAENGFEKINKKEKKNKAKPKVKLSDHSMHNLAF